MAGPFRLCADSVMEADSGPYSDSGAYFGPCSGAESGA